MKQLKDDKRFKILYTQFPENLLLTNEADSRYLDSSLLSNSRLLYDRSRCSYLRWHWKSRHLACLKKSINGTFPANNVQIWNKSNIFVTFLLLKRTKNLLVVLMIHYLFEVPFPCHNKVLLEPSQLPRVYPAHVVLIWAMWSNSFFS